MSNSKTIREWFDDLRPDIKKSALANTDVERLSAKDRSLHMAIEGAFIWSGSPEKHLFWANIYESIESGSTEFIKPTEQ